MSIANKKSYKKFQNGLKKLDESLKILLVKKAEYEGYKKKNT